MVCVCIDMEQPLGYVIYHARYPIKCPNNSARALSLEGASRKSSLVCVFTCLLVRWPDGGISRFRVHLYSHVLPVLHIFSLGH